MTAPGPPPMRYPRLRMAVGVLAAAFPVVVIFGIIPVYHWSRHVSFYRLNDVGYLSLGALIVAIVVLFVCLLTLLQLRRHLAAHAARDEQAAPRQAELDTAIGTPDADGLVSFVAAAPLEPGDHAAGAPLVDPYAYAPTPAELGRPVESTSTALRAAAARVTSADPTVPPVPPVPPVVDPYRPPYASPERPEKRGPVAGYGGRHSMTTVMPAVPAAPPVVAPPAPGLRAPTGPPPIAHPPVDVDAAPFGDAWFLPSPPNGSTR